MKKTVTVLWALGFCLLGVAPTLADDRDGLAPEHAAPLPALAPADRYFGRYRMSVLGMRNAIHDIVMRVDRAQHDDLVALFGKLTMVEDALLDLKTRFPSDTWVPKLGFDLAFAYSKMPLSAAQVRFNETLAWVAAEYPASDQAFYSIEVRQARLRLPESMSIPIEPILPSYAVPER